MKITLSALFLAAAVCAAPLRVTMDTTAFIGNPAGPFKLQFQFNDGELMGNGNNSATLSNFLFGGGSVSGVPALSGGVAGDTAAGITFTDTSAFNSFTVGFTPGNFLRFDVTLTDFAEPTFPDQLNFAILDGLDMPAPTSSFFDVFFFIDIPANVAGNIQTFAGDPGKPGGFATPAPVSAEIPEPSTVALLAAAAGLAALLRRNRS
jgi:hypothetical protein